MQKAVKCWPTCSAKRLPGYILGAMRPNTRQLVVSGGSFDYDSDYYGGDDFAPGAKWRGWRRQPSSHLIVYTLDANDMQPPLPPPRV